MTPSVALTDNFERDRRVWDACANTYEDRIVGGHPDVLAYEHFEEDLLDRVLLFLARDCERKLRLCDVGCGSGRLHLRYGLKTATVSRLSAEDASRVSRLRATNPAYAYDAVLSSQLDSIEGVDFSNEMLAIAKNKLCEAGLGTFLRTRLKLEQGSAFDLQPMAAEPTPVVVCVCNSIGVMQGPDGAAELFESVKRAVAPAGGVAIISAYHRDAVGTYALGNYESTMDVCGQPRWLVPDTYAGPEYQQVPLGYKRAYDPRSTLEVEVRDRRGNVVLPSHQLIRSEQAVADTLRSGHIRTYTDYESFWYSFELFDSWIASHWSGYKALHLAGRDLDALRGEPAQLAILDPAGQLTGLFERLLRNRYDSR